MQIGAVYAIGVGLSVLSQVSSYIEDTAAASSRNNYLENAARQTEQIGEKNRRIYENNARIATQEASLAKTLGDQNALVKMQEGEQALGTGRTLLASSGVDLLNDIEGGSPLDYFQQIAQDYRTQAEYEEWQGDYNAWVKLNEAQDYNQKGYLAQLDANSQAYGLRASKSSGPSLLGTVFSVGTTVAMGYTGYGLLSKGATFGPFSGGSQMVGVSGGGVSLAGFGPD